MRSFPHCIAALLLGTSLLFAACNSGNEAGSNEQINKPGTVAAATSSSGNIQELLDKAKQNKQIALLVLTSPEQGETDKAMTLARQVAQKLPAATVVAMNRADSANKAIADKWELNGIPLPAIFVVSLNGFLVSGYTLDEASEESLLAAIPTPKMDETLAALNEKKAVFLVVASGADAERPAALANCRAAGNQLKSGAAVVEIDKGSTEERSWLDNLGIDRAKAMNIVVINANGDKTDIFNKAVSVKELIASANKVVTNACCPAGSTCK